jgi:hypothetical protein
VRWRVKFHDAFEAEFRAYGQDVREELAAVANLLAEYGRQLGRPQVDTLKGSKYTNMKELRFEAADGEWRAAFAFDPHRKAIVLVAGDKSGGSQKRFYRQLIGKADQRFAQHLETLKIVKKDK